VDLTAVFACLLRLVGDWVHWLLVCCTLRFLFPLIL
jgi:hypothetical protein